MEKLNKICLQNDIFYLEKIEFDDHKLYLKMKYNEEIQVHLKNIKVYMKSRKEVYQYDFHIDFIEDCYLIASINNKFERRIVDGIADIKVSIENINYEFSVSMSNVYNIDNDNNFIIYSGQSLKTILFYKTKKKQLACKIYDSSFRFDISGIETEREKISFYIKNQNDTVVKIKNIFLRDTVGKENYFEGIKYDNNRVDIDILSFKLLDFCTFNFVAEIEIDNNDYHIDLEASDEGLGKHENYSIYPNIKIDNFHKALKLYYENNKLKLEVKNDIEISLKSIKSTFGKLKLVLEVPKNLKKLKSKYYFIVCSGDKILDKILLNDFKNNEVTIFVQTKKSNKLSYKITAVHGYLEEEIIIKNGLEKIEQNQFFKCFRDLSKSKNIEIHYSDKLIEIKDKKIFEYELMRISIKVGIKLIEKFAGLYPKKVWLVGENLSLVARDNGLSFMRFMTDNDLPEKAYYICDRNNADILELKKFKCNIVYKNTLKHIFLYAVSEYLIVAHGIRDVLPDVYNDDFKSNNKEIVYLQHGIIAMKRLGFKGKSYNNRIKKFAVSSEQEKNILIDYMNFNKGQVMVTGLSRFDYLKDKSKDNNEKIILIMPTWRDWLSYSENTFKECAFYKNYISLLNNKELIKIIKEKNIKILFYAHIEIQKKYMHLFENHNDSVVITNANTHNVKSMMEAASLLITDYSSVAFDFNYMKKPVLFYQFDLEDYMVNRGSYIDMEKELVGEVAYRPSELIELIKKNIYNDFKYDTNYAYISKKYYAYNDTSNSRRIYDSIKGTLNPKVNFLVYNIYGMGGTVRTVVNIANELANRGVDVEIISVKRTSKKTFMKINPEVKVTPLYDARSKFVYRENMSWLRKLVKRFVIELPSFLIHKDEDLYNMFNIWTDFKILRKIKSIRSGVLVTTIPSFNILSAKYVSDNVLKIGQEHKQWSDHSEEIKKKIRKNYNNLDKVMCLTDEAVDVYRAFLPKEKVVKIQNGTLMDDSIASLESKVIITAGRYVEEKGFDLLIKSSVKIIEKHPDWKIYIYGDGREREHYRSLINEYKLYNNVFLLGKTDELSEKVINASIYAVSSRFESFGMSVIEAMALGVPCVSFKTDGPSEIITNNKDGILIEQGDLNGFSDSIIRLIENEEERRSMGLEAKKSVMKYSMETIGDRWISILEEKNK